MGDKEIKAAVRDSYAQIAERRGSCCGPASACGGAPAAEGVARAIGYSEEELQGLPEGANLGLGCGNPVALASLKEGETVLDLGSGAGIDCLLAANKVGPKGKVIGVDMTSQMVRRARDSARKGGYANVEFRLGEIEDLPVADSSVDVVISNCVINLSPDKPKVFREAFRVLKPGGRMTVSDIVLLQPLPDAIKDSVAAYAGCLAGAALRDDYIRTIRAAGFPEVEVLEETPIPVDLMLNDATVQAVIGDLGMSTNALRDLARSVVSMKLQATKTATHS